MNGAVTVAAIAVVAYSAVLAALWRFQERIVFQPPANDALGDEGVPLPVTSGDGTALVARIIGEWRPGSVPVLAFHGNAVTSRWLLSWAREVARRFDAVVVLPEYRGYPGQPGVPTYSSIGGDAEALLDAATRRFGVGRSDFLIFGHSLGSAVAAELARGAGGRGLILQSPFTSARDMAARWPLPGLRLLWPLITRVHYDTLSIVKSLDVTVFVAHGDRDIVVPARMGRRIFSEARRPGRLLMIRGAGHSDVVEVGGEEYWNWITDAMGRSGRASERANERADEREKGR